MNENDRDIIFFISIFIIIPAGTLLLKWTTFQCLFLLSMLGIICKLTDLQDTIREVIKK